jgi:hypothetical protein
MKQWLPVQWQAWPLQLAWVLLVFSLQPAFSQQRVLSLAWQLLVWQQRVLQPASRRLAWLQALPQPVWRLRF